MMRIALAFIGLGLLCCTAVRAQDATVAGHIAHVENGLVGPVQIAGAPAETHTLAARMAEMHVPGVSVAVMHGGRIEWAKGYGVASIGGAAVTPQTRFQPGSISKSVAALAALRLVEQGKLSLDTDVNDSLKSWKLPPGDGDNARPVTLRELLSHTGGISIHGFPGYAAGEEVPTLVQILNGEKPANTKPIRIELPPGGQWQYSGGGYTIMQQMVIDASGQDFPTLLENSVLAPIGMTHSTYRQPLPDQFKSMAAAPNDLNGEPLKGGAYTYPELAAAGLWTTPSDILLFAGQIRASLSGQPNAVISAKMARAMVTPGLGSWGLGLQIGGSADNPHFGHGGDGAGFHGQFVVYEKSGDGAAVLTNGDQGQVLATEIIRAIAAEYQWPDYKPVLKTAMTIDPAILSRYAGTYALNPQFDLDITLENGRLIVQTVSAQSGRFKSCRSPMYAETSTKFFFLDAPAEIEFVPDATGRAAYLLDHEADGTHKVMRK